MKLHLLLFAALLSITLYSCKKIDGCTDPNALNYNADATCDDGSCIAKVFGCTDTASINYNPNATVDDGSCEYRGSVVIYSDYISVIYFYYDGQYHSGTTAAGNTPQIFCGAQGCVTFYDIPTQPGGVSYTYTCIQPKLDNSENYETVIIYPNVCTLKSVE